MNTYIYILAPDVGNNARLLHNFCIHYPDLVTERRVATAFKKSENDVLDVDGSIRVPAGAKYFYVKATASEFTPEMLSGVKDVQLFNKDNQPTGEFWLNI